MKMTLMKVHGDGRTGQVSRKVTDLWTMASDNKWSQHHCSLSFGYK